MRTIALEGRYVRDAENGPLLTAHTNVTVVQPTRFRCFVISSAQFLTSSDYPENHPMREKHGLDKVTDSDFEIIDFLLINY